MKRHRTHQIDEQAQRFFRAAIPETWTYNEQRSHRRLQPQLLYDLFRPILGPDWPAVNHRVTHVR